MKKNKKFDCVEMMHQGAERIRRETEGMTLEEQLEYWRQATEELRRLQQEVSKARKAS